MFDAVRLTNFTEFQRLYSGYLSSSYLAHSVFQFFNNGGSICFIARVARENVEAASVALTGRAGAPQVSMTVCAARPGSWGMPTIGIPPPCTTSSSTRPAR